MSKLVEHVDVMLTRGSDVLVIRAMWRISQKVCTICYRSVALLGPANFCFWNALFLYWHLADHFVAADIISTVEFDHTGNYLATGDKGGRVVLFERNETVRELCCLSISPAPCGAFKWTLTNI